jgi:hypothetical protein
LAEARAEVERLRADQMRTFRLLLDFPAARYLLSVLRKDGAEKAERHREMILAIMKAKGANWQNTKQYMRVHDATQPVTDHLDRIGLDLSSGFYEDSTLQKLIDGVVTLASAELTAIQRLLRHADLGTTAKYMGTDENLAKSLLSNRVEFSHPH